MDLASAGWSIIAALAKVLRGPTCVYRRLLSNQSIEAVDRLPFLLQNAANDRHEFLDGDKVVGALALHGRDQLLQFRFGRTASWIGSKEKLNTQPFVSVHSSVGLESLKRFGTKFRWRDRLSKANNV